jgi:hypothetical protein
MAAMSLEEHAQNGALRAAIISAEFLSFMAARDGAPLCALEEHAQNGALRAAIISAEFLSFMAAREGAPLCASNWRQATDNGW